DSPFDLEAYTDSDYAGASLDRKSTTGGCQFLERRLISWQCKKQTIVANSTTEADRLCTNSALNGMEQQLMMKFKLVLLVYLTTERELVRINIDDGNAFWNGIEVKTGISKTLIELILRYAYLKKPTGSEGFQEIVDFLNGSHISYALTTNPTIYVSLIEKFWQTATVKIVDN
ncbi:hypothetical protein Tco_1478985, partial [Tanacetum coccineum]